MSAAPAHATLFDWQRHNAVRRLESRRQELISQLARAKPRSERYFGLRAQIRELTLQELRLERGESDD